MAAERPAPTLLDEAVLRRALGGPRVMARQLRHLVEAAERPTVTLGVVPLAVGGHTGLTARSRCSTSRATGRSSTSTTS
ncbi:Scr1 family TA system antitoxin-like transcriptional regulator [Micromonospora sp. KC207]|uniref:Scr1 family TA system antitoxin-like transcriptional regulator n=1 Tax=Micromonospora sp. KC207 TaxID=2530377 RepID=UPI00352EC9C7